MIEALVLVEPVPANTTRTAMQQGYRVRPSHRGPLSPNGRLQSVGRTTAPVPTAEDRRVVWNFASIAAGSHLVRAASAPIILAFADLSVHIPAGGPVDAPILLGQCDCCLPGC
ncbi:hypothetical protein BV898_19895 [Hypsibius exemplaris]|uniref:Uncharacterized protein n=1 Tax=Hypsibius exemplaris TaxID=2072580 RepID=A0A9X6NRT7_HYPEX|nr:hypothetical protein BV898_19895 [Hypsibius exemplaris]